MPLTPEELANPADEEARLDDVGPRLEALLLEPETPARLLDVSAEVECGPLLEAEAPMPELVRRLELTGALEAWLPLVPEPVGRLDERRAALEEPEGLLVEPGWTPDDARPLLDASGWLLVSAARLEELPPCPASAFAAIPASSSVLLPAPHHSRVGRDIIRALRPMPRAHSRRLIRLTSKRISERPSVAAAAQSGKLHPGTPGAHM